MNRLKWIHSAVVFIFVFSLFHPNIQVDAASFEVGYSLVLELEDNPVITIRVQGFPGQTASFAFLGDAFGQFSNLQSVFKSIEVKDAGGQSLPWQWGNKRIIVTNGSAQDFTIQYTIDALNFIEGPPGDPSAKKYALFRYRRIFFIAGDIFPTPEIEPGRISVDYSLPEGVSLFSSLDSEGGTFVATKDLWGNLVYDFPKAYFSGGKEFFSISHMTEWGDEYEYIWFDRDPITEAWTSSYGNAPWEQAVLYMESAEACARYFREAFGPLPTHRVLFTNVIVQYEGFPSSTTNQDWFHYMQIWPRYSEPETCHHVFHQYSFWSSQSKMAFSGDVIGQMFAEGLPTYYEQIVPSLIFDDPRYSGKLFEFYSMDERGAPYGIRGNTFHVRYNRSALKVYLLDQYIQSVTNGSGSLNDFVKAIWEQVKNLPEPQLVSQTAILDAFASVVGTENTGYLYTLAYQMRFDLADLNDLKPSFASYVDWMSQEYFWGKDLLFYVYLDIASARGNEWPHYATYPHNIPRMRQEALQPFKDYLSTKTGSTLAEQDILDAMQVVTGRNHAGFFEFLDSLGIILDPQEIANLNSWNPEEHSAEDALPLAYNSAGTLKTDHLLRGFPQNATIILDAPIAGNQVYIQAQYWSDAGFIDEQDITKMLTGTNVTLEKYFDQLYQNIYITGAVFEITTVDPAGRVYPVILNYPLMEGYPRFTVATASTGDQIGDLYYLGPLDPIAFDLVNNNNTVLLPDTSLENETFLVTNGGDDLQFQPGESLTLSILQGLFDVTLLDQFGFVRGMGSVNPINTKPTVDFTYDPAIIHPQTMVEFNDNSVDTDGQVTAWQWNFGDGSISKERDPQHSFSEKGTYTVTLTVKDDMAGTSFHEEKIVVVEEVQMALNQQSQSHPESRLLITGGIILAIFLVAIFLVILWRKQKATNTV